MPILNGRPWNTAWGNVADPVVLTADVAGIGTSPTDITGLTVTFTALAGRRYRALCTFRLNQVSSASAPQGQLLVAGTQVDYDGLTRAAGEQTKVVLWSSFTASGSTTVKAQAFTGAGTVTVLASATAPAQLIVEDIGADI
jgi:hypothetical protein